MINYIWLLMMSVSIVTAISNGRIKEVTEAMMLAAQNAVELSIGLIGVMALWMGFMKIADEAGLLRVVAHVVRPFASLIFPSVPGGHPAMGAIVSNVSANVLGLGNAATPLGIQAMKELQTLNRRPHEASEAMCTFLALNTACLTVVPSTVLALRIALKSREPMSVIGTTLLSTLVTTCFALTLDAIIRRLSLKRHRLVSVIAWRYRNRR